MPRDGWLARQARKLEADAEVVCVYYYGVQCVCRIHRAQEGDSE